MQVDHSDPDQVARLVERLDRLDVLVNDVWGGDPLTDWSRFWEHSLEDGLKLIRQAVETHIITSHHAAPLMLRQGSGLIVEITDGVSDDYRGSLFYDLAKASVIRLAKAQAGDLRDTGDAIASIEGILSGTLAYLFNTYDGKTPFSSIVKAAKQKGYTEPDPRDDLSGMDVARKLIILGREMGLELELADVKVESLVPKGLMKCSSEEFLDRLPEYDNAMLERFQDARAAGKVLRYVGRLDAQGGATVGLVQLEARHPFANIALTDNVVRYVTRRYCDNPLIVQGPGAGPEVTAGGVFSDLLRLCAYLGAKL